MMEFAHARTRCHPAHEGDAGVRRLDELADDDLVAPVIESGLMAESVDEYFEGKPGSRAIFDQIADHIAAVGQAEIHVASQISFGVNRKFAWFWLYNITRKNPDGVPHLMLAMDHEVDDPHVRDVAHIGKTRWNHQIVVRTIEDAASVWLKRLITEAFDYGSS
jgi:hypothetical protein